MRGAITAVDSGADARRHRRKFIKRDGYPATALIWRGARAKSVALRKWRGGVSRAFSAQASCLRVAWILEWLFGKDGFAFPTDAFIARETGMALKHVQRALTALERSGAIVRASVFIDGRPQRRIWPCSAVIPPDVGGMATPKDAADIPPNFGGEISQEGKRQANLSSTVLEARRAAQIREQRSLERMRAEGATAEGPAKPHPALRRLPWGGDL
ncbi:hypothetical protein ABIA43_006805 [Bradyrhizobium sp. USDA 328]